MARPLGPAACLGDSGHRCPSSDDRGTAANPGAREPGGAGRRAPSTATAAASKRSWRWSTTPTTPAYAPPRRASRRSRPPAPVPPPRLAPAAPGWRTFALYGAEERQDDVLLDAVPSLRCAARSTPARSTTGSSSATPTSAAAGLICACARTPPIARTPIASPRGSIDICTARARRERSRASRPAPITRRLRRFGGHAGAGAALHIFESDSDLACALLAAGRGPRDPGLAAASPDDRRLDAIDQLVVTFDGLAAGLGFELRERHQLARGRRAAESAALDALDGGRAARARRRLSRALPKTARGAERAARRRITGAGPAENCVLPRARRRRRRRATASRARSAGPAAAAPLRGPPRRRGPRRGGTRLLALGAHAGRPGSQPVGRNAAQRRAAGRADAGVRCCMMARMGVGRAVRARKSAASVLILVGAPIWLLGATASAQTAPKHDEWPKPPPEEPPTTQRLWPPPEPPRRPRAAPSKEERDARRDAAREAAPPAGRPSRHPARGRDRAGCGGSQSLADPN